MISRHKTTRARGMAAWRPQKKTAELLHQVGTVLQEYADYVPLTIRQIFYRLVGVHGYDKTEQAYARLCEHINRARRAGIIAFDAIRDDGISVAEPQAWDDAAELVRSFVQHAHGFRLDRHAGQPAHLVFAVEAAGMVPQVRRIADEFGIEVQSSGGFDSLTTKHDLAHRHRRRRAVEVLHIGDHDPSGVHVFSSMAEDVHALVRDLGFRVDFAFSRLAVTPAQIVDLNLPTAAPKETDRRSFTGEAVQCEAIPPDVLSRIVRVAIETRLDWTAFASVLHAEKDARAMLTERLDPIVADFL